MTRQDPVKTAARTLELFEVFAQAKQPLTLTELANRIGSPISSCHALVKTLQARGYVYVLDERKRVYPTKRLLGIAQSIAQSDPVLDRLSHVLKDLLKATGETIILGKRQGSFVTYLEVIEGTQTIRYAASPGDNKPLHSSAIGKAMLGNLPAVEMASLLKRIRLERVTAHTITELEILTRDLAESRARGYFITRGENVADVMAVAIACRLGDEYYGLAVAGPIARIEAHASRVIDAVLKAGEVVRELDRELLGLSGRAERAPKRPRTGLGSEDAA